MLIHKKIADKTLEILNRGSYEVDGFNNEVGIDVDNSVMQTKTYSPEELQSMIVESSKGYSDLAKIRVVNQTTIEAILDSGNEFKTAALNFASAKNPGGGFMRVAVAQEESLARSSSLYKSLIKDDTFYKNNKQEGNFLYTDYMIYSPNVVFWMNDSGAFLKTPVLMNIITSPAPNKRAMLKQERNVELVRLPYVLENRMLKFFALAKANGIEKLILGAWGCGVFGNEYEDVAKSFRNILQHKCGFWFKELVFAIPENETNTVASNAFKKHVL